MSFSSVRGWVYVITNKAMPGLLKIGYTLKDPIIRAAEFNGTGVPHPYDVEYEALVENPRDVEQQSHSRLQKYREGREWFRCDLSIAVGAIQLYSLNRVFLENFVSPSFNRKTQLQMAREEIANLENKIAYLESDEYRFQDAINSDDIEWKKCVARYPYWPTELIVELYNCDTSFLLSPELAGNPSMSDDCIHQLVEMCLDEVCEPAVHNPTTRADTLALIRWITGDEFKEEVAEHQNYKKDIFYKLLEEKSSDSDYLTRAWVSEFSDCPEYLLKKLAADENISVRLAVASNPICPLDVIYQLQYDDEELVQNAVLNNIKKRHGFVSYLEGNKTPAWVLLKFHQNENYLYRQAVALNPECPKEILDILSSDPDIRVRIAAKHRIKK